MVPSDFAITVDFLPSNLDLGRVGVRFDGGGKIVINEDFNVTIMNLGDPISQDGGTTEYADNITITEVSSSVVIRLDNYGLEISRVRDGENALYIDTTTDEVIAQYCGLCGANGTLLYRDRETTASIMNRMEVEMFADSWQATPSEQFLRDRTRERGEWKHISHKPFLSYVCSCVCATTVCFMNDTIL